ncbi:MAG: capsule assembly Wzi family protein [Treponema sp.]|nr:capsule assembly Wzi family protein [Treponema sp.]
MMISAGDPVLEDIRYILRESDMSFLSFTPPLSRDEVLQFLETLDPAALSPPAREAYNRIEKKLNPGFRFSEGLFSLNAHITAALGGRARTNRDIPWGQNLKDNPGFFSLPIEFFFADSFELNFEPVLTSDPAFYETGDFFWTSLPYEAKRFDMNMPLRAFGAAGGSWWNFQLGRDRISFGAAFTGNLALSDTPDYYDFARLSVFSPNFKYSVLATQLPLILSSSLADPETYDAGDTTSTVNRYMYLHRLDFRLFEKLSLGITEAVMVGNAPFELRYLNPLAVFHSFFSWRDYPIWGKKDGDLTGSLFSLDIEWAIASSLHWYGQLVMNEFSTPYEKKRWPDSQPPNGLGYLCGLEYARPLNAWGAAFYGEFVYTDPFLYVLSSPFASFIWMRRLSDIGSKGLRYSWTGHPQGRDALLFTLGSLFFKGNLSYSADLSFTRRGEHSLYWDWGAGPSFYDQHTPTGIAENQLSAAFQAKWKALPFLTLRAYLSGSMIFNSKHIEKKRAYGLDTAFYVILTY